MSWSVTLPSNWDTLTQRSTNVPMRLVQDQDVTDLMEVSKKTAHLANVQDVEANTNFKGDSQKVEIGEFTLL